MITASEVPGTEQPVDSTDNGWKLLSTTYTCVHPPDCTPAPELLAEIRTFHPTFVPVWMLQEWRQDNKAPEVFGYHLFASHTHVAENPDDALPLHITDFPASFPFTGGYIYPGKPWTFSLPNADPSAVGPYAEQFLPFDSTTVDHLRSLWHYINSPGSFRQKWAERAEALRADKFRKLAQVSLEKRLQLRDDRNYLMRLIGDGKFFPTPEDGPTTASTSITSTAAWDRTEAWGCTEGGIFVPPSAS